MNKFTPGPWSFDYNNSDNSSGGQWYEVSAPIWFPYNASKERKDIAKSNARLMAAAPDLLEALENLENDGGSIPAHAWDMVKSAIARARGQP